MKNAATLDVKDFSVHFMTSRGPVKAVNRISFSVYKGERLGLVGESGCGKTTTVLGIMRLIEFPGSIAGGEVILDGKTDLVVLKGKQMRKVRFNRISMIPQGAMNSLNPVRRIRHQFSEVFESHGQSFKNKRKESERIRELLLFVGLKESVIWMYPHELSGGMKQRVCIAMAISLSPQLVLADEPTSALDVVVQRQVMATLEHVQEKLGSSVILIGHDMGLMAQFVDRIAVMYAGRIIEIAPVHDIFKKPLHPYSQFLIQSLPSLERKELFRGIPGAAPSLVNPPPGCTFHPRCPYAEKKIGCMDKTPELAEIAPGRRVACHLFTRESI